MRFSLGWIVLALFLGAEVDAAEGYPLVGKPNQVSAVDEDFFWPSPLLVGGFRLQTVDRGVRPDLFFGGVNLLWWKKSVGDQGAFWSFFAPGLQYQSSDENRITFSLAPAAYISRSGLAFALQIFPFDPGRTGGVFGFSIGGHFF
jgi:hypothetical protein